MKNNNKFIEKLRSLGLRPTEQRVKLMTILRGVDNTINVGDTRVALRVLLRSIEEGVNVSTFREKIRVITRVINNTLQISHNYRLAFARTFTESVEITDGRVFLRTLLRVFNALQ